MAISTRKLIDDGEYILIDCHQDADSATPVTIWDVSASTVVTFEILEMWWSAVGDKWQLLVNNTTDAVLWGFEEDSSGYLNFQGELNHIGRLPGLTQTGHATDGDLQIHQLGTFAAGDSLTLRVRCRKLT